MAALLRSHRSHQTLALVAACLLLTGTAFAQGESSVSENIERLLQFQNGNAAGATTQQTLSIPAIQQTTTGPAAGNTSLSSNAGTGFAANANNGTINLTMNNNTFSNNAANGFALNATNGGSVGGTITNNTVANNQGNGMVVGGFNGQVSLGDVSGNVFAGNSGGVLFDAQNSNISMTFTGNTIIGSTAAGNSFGIGGTVDGGTFNLNLGGNTTTAGNTITQTAAAGVGFLLSGNAQASLNIQNNTIGNTQAGSATNFNGAGIQVNLTQNATLQNSSITGNAVQNNAGNGVSVTTNQSASVNSLTVSNNDITDNTGTGLEMERFGDGVMDDVSITANVLEDNGIGLSLTAANTNTTDSYLISGNLISNNSTAGAQFDVQADATLLLDLNGNVIDGNGIGVLMTEAVNSANDQRGITGTMTANVITNNTSHGFSINGATDGLIIGSDSDPLLGNLIDANGGDGIEINGSGDITIGLNAISNNGTGGIDLNAATANTVFVVSNEITGNIGDGIEVLNSSGPFGVTMIASDNVIDGNTGRGVDILNRGTADSFISLEGNSISGNGEEAVYVVNTASTSQNQSDASTATMASNGSVFAVPRLAFEMHDNVITGNGSATGLSGTGLVIRVGTSDGGYSYEFAGGFASQGFGGVVADVTGNQFSGNFGNDVFIESFTSSGSGSSGTTWSTTVFSAPNYQSDPLARLDLNFVGNTGDSTNVTRPGAFFENNDATFKSRTTAQNPAGPFVSGTRERNAQRLAFRGGAFSAPGTSVGDSDDFLYPGVGGSTFRVTSASNTLGFGDSGGVFDDFNSSVFRGTGTGETSYRWDRF